MRGVTQTDAIFPCTLVLRGVLTLTLLSVSVATPLRAGEAKLTIQQYSQIPLSFERHGASEFAARGQGYVIGLRSARATITLGESKTVLMEFVRGREVPAIAGQERGKVNYIYGSDPRRWRLGLPTYEQITYADVYPGIDVVYYGNQNQLGGNGYSRGFPIASDTSGNAYSLHCW